MKKITTKELKDIFGQNDLVLLNVLPEEYYKATTIKNSKNACVYKTSFSEDIKKLVKDKDTNIVVFGLNKKHEAAARAGFILNSIGYKNIYIYEDGIEGWEKSGGKLEGNKNSKAKVK